MASSLSHLVDNLAEGIHKIKCKDKHNNTKCKLNTMIVSAVLNIQMLNMI